MWLDNPQDEEQTNVNGQPAVGGNLSVGAGGGTGGLNKPSPSGITGNPSTITPVQSNQLQQQFATVQDYLGANKQQGEDLGQKFTSNLADTAKQEKGTIDTAVAGAQNDITAGTTNFDAGLVNKAASNPTEVANDPGQLGSFLKQWNASYSGPQSFEASTEYNPAITAANEASDKAAQLSSAGGQQQLLHDQFGVYGQGNQGLDQAILQNSSAYPTVQQAAPAFKSINDYLGSQAQATDAQAQQAAANTAAAKTNTQNAFSNSLSNFQTNLNNRVTQAQQAATTNSQKYKQDLASGNIDAVTSDLKQAGTSDQDIQSITQYLQNLNKDYGITPDLSNNYTFNPNIDINSADVATPEDYNNAAAYQTLTGVNYGGVLDPTNSAQAGTAPNPISGINTSGISNYLKTNLTQQDQSLLKTPLSVLNPKTGTPNPTLDSSVDKYIDAATRQGINFKDSPVLQQLMTDATNAITTAVQGGAAANNPNLVSYQNTIQKLQNYGANPPTFGGVSQPGNAHTPMTGTPINKLINPVPVNGAKTGKDLSQSLISAWQSSNPGAKPEFLNATKADAAQVSSLYDQYMNKSISPKDFSSLQTLLKKYNINI